MKVAVSNDKSGYGLKQMAVETLREMGHEVIDLGTHNAEELLFHPEAGSRVGKAVSQGEAERGCVFCGTGMGVALMANKYKGVYAAVVESTYAARKCREINGCNVICMGGFIVGKTMAKEMLELFMNTEFAPESFGETRQQYMRNQLQLMQEIEQELVY